MPVHKLVNWLIALNARLSRIRVAVCWFLSTTATVFC